MTVEFSKAKRQQRMREAKHLKQYAKKPRNSSSTQWTQAKVVHKQMKEANSYYMLHTTYYILHTTYYILHTTYYIQHTTYCILHTTYYIVHTTHYILHTT